MYRSRLLAPYERRDLLHASTIGQRAGLSAARSPAPCTRAHFLGKQRCVSRAERSGSAASRGGEDEMILQFISLSIHKEL
ncbi:hypothetical protein GN956_G21955 [Arapaima gigas]